MSSKDDILKAVRRQTVPTADLPDLNQPWIKYEDRLAQFQIVLESVGGKAILVQGLEGLSAALQELPVYRNARKTISCVDGIVGSEDLARLEDPHALEDIDFALLPGQFGVAENGAVWVTDAPIKHRVVLFIPQHIGLVLRCPGGVADAALVDNMPQAYERMTWNENHFGCFVSGPSKTADIEQSLVIGAHGARSLHVFLVT